MELKLFAKVNTELLPKVIFNAYFCNALRNILQNFAIH
jgi:hypothetical protein